MKMMMRMGWTAGAALFVVACGGGAKTAPAPESPPTATPPPAPETPPAPPAPPPPPPKTDGEQKLADAYLECQKALNGHDEKALAACYTDSATAQDSDSPDKPMVGGAAIAAGWKDTWTSFPDFAMRAPMIIVNGDRVAAVVHGYGMQSGPFMGAKPTNRTIGVYAVRLMQFADGKINQETNVYDPFTLLTQVGRMKGPARKASNPPAGEPKVVLATDSKTESDNVAAVKAFCDGFNKHDVATISNNLADEANWSDQTSPTDISGKANIEKELSSILKAFPDINVTCDAWGAGDYVVSWTSWTATNKAAWKEMGIAKPTNKQVAVHDGEVFELVNGKIKNYWRFSNGLALGVQLGIMKPPPPPKAPKAPKPKK